MAISREGRSLATVLGPDSPSLKQAAERLSSVFEETESMAPVDNSYRYWMAARPFDGDTSPGVFIRHTCLSLLCRLIAYRYLEHRPSERDLWNVISGDYFLGAGLGNFLGEDFFSWPFFRLSMGIGDDALSMETAKGLMTALESLQLEQPTTGMLSELHREFEGVGGRPELHPDFSALEDNPSLSCVAPFCGDGAALAHAARAAMEGRLANGEIPPDALHEVCGQFLGMTGAPLAATVASVAFVLAMGEELLEPHPPILIPVYLAHGDYLPASKPGENGASAFAIESAGSILLPESVAADPLYLDWLLGRLPNYMRGAALRLRAQSTDVAVQEVLNAWYNYLTSPKVRTPIPEPLSPDDADVMVEAARSLIMQYISGSGPGPLHIVRNAPAPLIASRRRFEAMLWPQRFAGDPSLRETCAGLYLGENGIVITV